MKTSPGGSPETQTSTSEQAEPSYAERLGLVDDHFAVVDRTGDYTGGWRVVSEVRTDFTFMPQPDAPRVYIDRIPPQDGQWHPHEGRLVTVQQLMDWQERAKAAAAREDAPQAPTMQQADTGYAAVERQSLSDAWWMQRPEPEPMAADIADPVAETHAEEVPATENDTDNAQAEALEGDVTAEEVAPGVDADVAVMIEDPASFVTPDTADVAVEKLEIVAAQAHDVAATYPVIDALIKIGRLQTPPDIFTLIRSNLGLVKNPQVRARLRHLGIEFSFPEDADRPNRSRFFDDICVRDRRNPNVWYDQQFKTIRLDGR